MNFDIITKEHVAQAIASIDTKSISDYRQSTKYDLFIKNERYPIKIVIEKAYEIATGLELSHKDFNSTEARIHFVKIKLLVVKKEINIWKVSQPEGNRDEGYQNYTCSQGWNHGGDLSWLFYNYHKDDVKLKIEILPLLPEWLRNNNDKVISTFWNLKDKKSKNAFKRLFKEIKSGDIIIIYRGRTPEYIGEVPEQFGYFFFDNLEFSNCLFPIKYHEINDVFTDSKSVKGGSAQGIKGIETYGGDIQTIKDSWYSFREREEIVKVFPEEKEKEFIDLINKLPSFIENSRKNILNKINSKKMTPYIELLKSNKNLIFTGVPGTGKTYLAKEIAEELILPKNLGVDFVKGLINDSFNEELDIEVIEQVDNSWQYWKQCILSDDFCLDDFANTLSNVKNTERLSHGGYLMNFLERTSSIYGSSKPGNAYRYGIKMNNDNHSYTIYTDQNNDVEKNIAENVFNENIKNWLHDFVASSLEEKIQIIEKGHHLIKAGQLLRKIIVLEHPDELLSIYQSDTVSNAYKYFVKGNEKSYYGQNKGLLSYFADNYDLKDQDTKVSQLKISHLIWKYFSEKSSENIEEIEQNIVKTYFDDHFSFVQFHPSYDYTDFVEGLRPVKKDGKELGFELKNGTFKEFCKKAKKSLDNDIAGGIKKEDANKFVFVIDEINRAEISKVFGELFFSIDPGYRGIEGKVKTQYANIQTEDTFFTDIDNDFFYIPENVYIIGTMNDIDRSVESFDFAMRRRFAWKEIMADDRVDMWRGGHKEAINEYADEADKKMKSLNIAIESIEGLNSSYHIGPAYFLKLNNYKGDFGQLWNNHIQVLLQEYLRGMHDAEAKMDKLKKAYNLES